MAGKRYYDLLGLPENSTDQEVKKRFRILAKQYHPDVNPDADATQVFATLLDAYERILTKNFSERRTSASTSPHNNNREDEQRDFHRRAWERYQQMEQEKKEALDAFYVSFLKGPKMRIKKVLAIVSLLIFSALVADEFLPFRVEEDTIQGFDTTRYQVTGGDFAYHYTTAKGLGVYAKNLYPYELPSSNKIRVYQTYLCRSTSHIEFKSRGGMYRADAAFTFFSLRIVLYVLCLFCIFMPFYRKANTFLVLGTWFAFFMGGIWIILFLLMHFRIISLLTLGTWP
ncbi:MAG: hypothetical protein EBV19_00995 [Flavobacteriia bacterium]|nr:hypothetical protein [Flavobacteriia bacterium]